MSSEPSGTTLPGYTVGPATDADRFLASDQLNWPQPVTTTPVADRLHDIPADQRFAVEPVVSDGSATPYAGLYAVYPMRLGVPGGTLLPTAGLTWVSVHPDHRRRGILTLMLRDHLERCRKADLSVSALHASEQGIYGRHGYGIASMENGITLDSGTRFTAPHLEAAQGELSTSFGTVTDAGVPRRLRNAAEYSASINHGSTVFAPEFYEQLCTVRPEDYRDQEPPRVLLAQRDGVDVGSAVIRREFAFEDGRSRGKATISHLTGDPATRLALLRRIVSLDLISSVKIAGIGVHDPVWSWITGIRGTTATVGYDNLWVRLVDLPTALAARSYDADATVVVEIADSSAPWNQGCWRIRIAEGAAEATRTEDDPEIRLPIAQLGAAYLGGGNLVQALRAGQLEELREGAVSELWRAMRTDVEPTPASDF